MLSIKADTPRRPDFCCCCCPCQFLPAMHIYMHVHYLSILNQNNCKRTLSFLSHTCIRLIGLPTHLLSQVCGSVPGNCTLQKLPGHYDPNTRIGHSEFVSWAHWLLRNFSLNPGLSVTSKHIVVLILRSKFHSEGMGTRTQEIVRR